MLGERSEVVLEAGRRLDPVQPRPRSSPCSRASAPDSLREWTYRRRARCPPRCSRRRADERAVVGEAAGQRRERGCGRAPAAASTNAWVTAPHDRSSRGSGRPRCAPRSGSARRTATGGRAARASRSPAGGACPRRGRAGSRRTRGSSRRSRARAPARGRRGCAPGARVPGLAAEQVDGHGLEGDVELPQGDPAASCSWPDEGWS